MSGIEPESSRNRKRKSVESGHTTAPRPIRCEDCNEVFAQQQTLKRHFGTRKHLNKLGKTSTATTSCPHCSKGFARNHDVQRHIGRAHKDVVARTSAQQSDETVYKEKFSRALGHTAVTDCDQVLDDGEREDSGIAFLSEPASDTSLANEEGPSPAPNKGTSSSKDDNASSRVPAEDIERRMRNLNLFESTRLSRDALIKAGANPTPGSMISEPRCTECRQPYEHDVKDLSDHLENHQIEQQYPLNSCNDCGVAFICAQDLQWHQESAATRGDCGFDFKHESKCTGHHPPSMETKLNRNNAAFKDAKMAWEAIRRLNLFLRAGRVIQKRSVGTQAIEVLTGFRYSLDAIRRRFSRESLLSDHSCPAAIATDETDRGLVTSSHGASGPSSTFELMLKDFFINHQDQHGNTPLHCAIQHSDLNAVRDLIAIGANVLVENEDNLTSLHLAAAFSDVRVVHVILKTGISMHTKDSLGRTALDIASMTPSLKVARFLLDRGADPFMSDNCDLGTLRFAKATNSSGSIAAIDASGVELDVDALDESGRSALHIAASMGYTVVVQALISCRAKIHAVDHRGRTPLYCAAETDSTRLVGMLIEAGAAVNVVDLEGWTPLQIACHHGHADVVRLLIDHGAQVDNEEQRP